MRKPRTSAYENVKVNEKVYQDYSDVINFTLTADNLTKEIIFGYTNGKNLMILKSFYTGNIPSPVYSITDAVITNLNDDTPVYSLYNSRNNDINMVTAVFDGKTGNTVKLTYTLASNYNQVSFYPKLTIESFSSSSDVVAIDLNDDIRQIRYPTDQYVVLDENDDPIMPFETGTVNKRIQFELIDSASGETWYFYYSSYTFIQPASPAQGQIKFTGKIQIIKDFGGVGETAGDPEDYFNNNLQADPSNLVMLNVRIKDTDTPADIECSIAYDLI